jgi:hypothetical protein
MPTARTTRAKTGNRTARGRRTTTSRRKPGASKQAGARAGRTSRLSRTLVDHDEIRSWVEQRGGWPAAVKRTSRGEGDIGMIRIDFPGYSGEGKLERIDWEDWFGKFDESNLALIVQERTAGGEISHFNKLVSRETIEERDEGRRAKRGQTSGRRTAGHRGGTTRSGPGRGGQRSSRAASQSAAGRGASRPKSESNGHRRGASKATREPGARSRQGGQSRGRPQSSR